MSQLTLGIIRLLIYHMVLCGFFMHYSLKVNYIDIFHVLSGDLCGVTEIERDTDKKRKLFLLFVHIPGGCVTGIAEAETRIQEHRPVARIQVFGPPFNTFPRALASS